jgi:Domain of Unknown Function (DUF1080).
MSPSPLRFVRASVFVLASLPVVLSADDGWRKLFNGEDLEGWTPLLNAPGEIGDYVKVVNGEIHIYADNPAPDRVPFGVLMTQERFERFHLRLQYRWGTKKFEPRANDIRDAGVLYHIYNAERVWPRSVECQIQEGDTGDLIFLSTGGVSWELPRGKDAPDGQGDPALLPESGGVPRAYFNREFGPYLGRFPELDTLEGWNTVDVIVHGSASAVHLVNGEVCARVFEMRKPVGDDWVKLESGRIAIQLEGAELFYRNIEICELPPAIQTSSRYLTVSSVADTEGAWRELVVTNPDSVPRDLTWTVLGESPDVFEIEGPSQKTLAPGESATIRARLRVSGEAGRYSAGLRIGDEEDGAFVVLEGLRLAAMEGSNEPPLERILDALGTAADVGGPDLAHDTKGATLGGSIAGGKLRALGEVTITPVARFSPPGVEAFGIVADDGKRTTLGALANSATQADAHQCLWPPLEGDKASVKFGKKGEAFAMFVEAGGAVLSTDPATAENTKVPHPARIWPIDVFQGSLIENAVLVGFEEAKNGDYQDALFLVENVEVISPEN